MDDYEWKLLKVHFMLLYATVKYIQFKKHDTMRKNL